MFPMLKIGAVVTVLVIFVPILMANAIWDFRVMLGIMKNACVPLSLKSSMFLVIRQYMF